MSHDTESIIRSAILMVIVMSGVIFLALIAFNHDWPRRWASACGYLIFAGAILNIPWSWYYVGGTHNQVSSDGTHYADGCRVDGIVDAMLVRPLSLILLFGYSLCALIIAYSIAGYERRKT